MHVILLGWNIKFIELYRFIVKTENLKNTQKDKRHAIK